MDSIRVGISYMYEPGFNRALLPLLASGEVDALEWSFDTMKDHKQMPEWMQQLLKEYAAADRLYGHGVYYSIFSGKWYDRHTLWFERLGEVLKDYKFRHISEHFGFMTSGNAHEGAPLPAPFSDATLQLGIERLKKLSAFVQVPLGIENLAFSFSAHDLEQGEFLKQLIEPVNGFILLDLHNIYCQAANFGVDALDIVKTYPLSRVKEIHVSGGSWEDSVYAAKPIRRDTHDHSIPEEVFTLLESTVPLCPNLEVVIVERLGDTLLNEEDEVLFQQEFLRTKGLVKTIPFKLNNDSPFSIITPSSHLKNPENIALYEQQNRILNILKESENARQAHFSLQKDPDIDQQLWQIDHWQLAMIETAILLGRKWGVG